MGKDSFKIEGTIDKEYAVNEVRKAARQFALLYFHFSKVLYEQFGLEQAKEIIQRVVFEQAVDRSDQMKEKDWLRPSDRDS